MSYFIIQRCLIYYINFINVLVSVIHIYNIYIVNVVLARICDILNNILDNLDLKQRSNTIGRMIPDYLIVQRRKRWFEM